MIRATASADSLFTLNASVNGPVVYLDNWAIYDLAEGDVSRRTRFIESMRCGVELLFSMTNAAELSGPKGQSADAVRAFLNEIGPRWFPVELGVVDVVWRELNGVDPARVCIAEGFLKSYVAELIRKRSGDVVVLSDEFFRLGAILDYMGPQRESIRDGSVEFDELLKKKIGENVDKCKADASLLDTKFPIIPFTPRLRIDP